MRLCEARNTQWFSSPLARPRGSPSRVRSSSLSRHERWSWPTRPPGHAPSRAASPRHLRTTAPACATPSRTTGSWKHHWYSWTSEAPSQNGNGLKAPPILPRSLYPSPPLHQNSKHGPVFCLPFSHRYCCVTLYSPMFISVRVPHHAVSGESWQDAG